MLDDTQTDADPDAHGYGHGSLDKERFKWLVRELNQGQAENKLMIIAAHISIGIKLADAGLGALMTYTVTALKSPDPTHPEFGFWEVETSSLRDFPQQFRTFEIYQNMDNTISIFTTDVFYFKPDIAVILWLGLNIHVLSAFKSVRV